MRHETVEMALRNAHLAPAHKRAAVEALAKSLAGTFEGEEKAAKEKKEGKEGREAKDKKETKETKEVKEAKETKEPKK